MKRLLYLIFVLGSLTARAQSVDGGLKTLTATGTNTYVISEPLPATYDPKERFLVRFTNANTGAATLNRAALGVKAIQKAGAVALSSGDIVAGGTYLLSYNGTYYQLVGDGGGGGGSGTVTSVAALTLGTTGTDLSSSVANPTTTPVITLNVPTASGSNRGALSSADWTTFNSKVSGSGTTNELPYWTGATSLGALAVATYPNLTELSYVKGLTGPVMNTFWKTAGTSTLTAQSNIAMGGFDANFLNGNVLFGPTGATITASTRMDIRGVSGQNALRVANAANSVPLLSIPDGGARVAWTTDGIRIQTNGASPGGISFNGTTPVTNNLIYTAGFSFNNANSSWSSGNHTNISSGSGSATNSSGTTAGLFLRYNFTGTSTAAFNLLSIDNTSVINAAATGQVNIVNITPSYTSLGGSVTGLNIDPTVGTVTGTLLSVRAPSGSNIFGRTTLSGGTNRIEINGIGTTSGFGLLIHNSASTPTFGFRDDSKFFHYATPANDNALTDLLVRDGATGEVKYRTVGSLPGSGDMVLASAQTSTGKKTLQSNGTNAGLNLGDGFIPSSLVNGDIFQNAGLLRVQLSGGLETVITDNLTQTLTNKTLGSNTIISSDLSINSSVNIVLGTTTGTRLGTSTSQKIGVFGATPIVQPSAVTTSQGFINAISSLGWIANSTLTGDGLAIGADGTDANITAAVNTSYYLPAATLTSNRNFIMPTGANGDVIKIHNNEATYSWILSGATVYLADRTTTVTALLYNVPTLMKKISGLWIIEN